MKSNQKFLSEFFIAGLIGTLILCASITVKAQANIQKVVRNHIEKVRQDASEYEEARKIVYDDVDGDVTKDAVVQYTLEGFGGGNGFAIMLAVFTNKRGVYKFAAEKVIGGKFPTKTFTLENVKGKKILAVVEICPDIPRPTCKNPRRGKAAFILNSGKLKEL